MSGRKCFDITYQEVYWQFNRNVWLLWLVINFQEMPLHLFLCIYVLLLFSKVIILFDRNISFLRVKWNQVEYWGERKYIFRVFRFIWNFSWHSFFSFRMFPCQIIPVFTSFYLFTYKSTQVLLESKNFKV